MQLRVDQAFVPIAQTKTDPVDPSKEVDHASVQAKTDSVDPSKKGG